MQSPESSEGKVYRFEDVEVDLSRNCVFLAGEERHLRKKTFAVLVYLLERQAGWFQRMSYLQASGVTSWLPMTFWFSA